MTGEERSSVLVRMASRLQDRELGVVVQMSASDYRRER